MELFLVDRVELRGVLPALGWTLEAGSWVLDGRCWRATVVEAVPVEDSAAPKPVSDRQVGIAWRIEAHSEGAGTGSARVTRALREVARVGHGVVLDGGEVWKPGPSARLRPVPIRDQKEFLTLSWWADGGRLSSPQRAEGLIRTLADVLPEAVPYKWRLADVGNWQRDDAVSMARSIAGRGAPSFEVSFEVKAPFTEFAVHWCSGPRTGRPVWLPVRSLEIEVAAAVLDQPGWGRHLSRVFRVVSEVIVPFYGEARVNKAEYRGRTRYIENPSPIAARYWYGFPRSVPLAMVVGPPYLPEWDLPGGEPGGELLFYSSGSWPDPPAGGVPQAPESFLQEHDLHWKSLEPMFPGMGRGITGDHPSRAPNFWPFATIEDPAVAGPPRSQRPKPEPPPPRRYEWPAVELGSLPPGSYFRPIPPQEWGPGHGGRRVRPKLTGATWEEWGRSSYTAIQADDRRRPERNTLPEGVEPAAATLNAVLRDVIGPALRNLGLAGSGGVFRLERHGHQAGVAFQRSRHNHKGIAEFTINLEGTATRWSRIGQVLPEMEDTWWVLPAGASTDRLEADLLESLRDYALMAIGAALEEPPPPSPWMDPRPAAPGLEVRKIWQIYAAPPTLDQLYEDAINGNPAHSPTDRAVVIAQFLRQAGPDRRCAPILLDDLNHEPDPLARETSALRLAFTDVAPTAITPALTETARNDPDRSVRASARYALRLLENRPSADAAAGITG